MVEAVDVRRWKYRSIIATAESVFASREWDFGKGVEGQ
jgi:hypothetical protein